MGNSEKRELLALPDELSEALDLSQWPFGPREQNKPAPRPFIGFHRYSGSASRSIAYFRHISLNERKK